MVIHNPIPTTEKREGPSLELPSDIPSDIPCKTEDRLNTIQASTAKT
jgi:hypothetical protein